MGILQRLRDAFAPVEVADVETREYGTRLSDLMPQYGATLAGPAVSERSTLALAAAWRCVNLLADGAATLPIHAYRSDSKVVATPRILERPNGVESRYDTVFQVVTSLVLRGNAYLLLGEFTDLGWPQSYIVLHPDDVSVRRVDGRVEYRVKNVELAPYELRHIKGFTMPGCITGLGVIEAQREGIAHALALQEYGARFYREAAVPPVAIEVEDDIDQEEANALKAQWVAAHGNGSREPAILPNRMKVERLAFSPEDAEFIAARQFSAQEVANMFGVPGHFVGAPGNSMTYSNVEQEGLNFVKWSLRPWLSRIELALSDLLPRGTVAKFNVDAHLRADTVTRYTAHAIALDSGFLTIDEVRELENREPLPEAAPQPMPEDDTEEGTD